MDPETQAQAESQTQVTQTATEAAPVTVTPAVETQPTTQTAQTLDVDGADAGTYREWAAQLRGGILDELDKSAQGEVPAAEPATQPEQVPPVVTPAVATVTPEEEAKDLRIRLTGVDKLAQEAILLVKSQAAEGKRITLTEAERRVNILHGIDPDATPAAQAAAAAAVVPKSVSSIDDELKAAREERRQAGKEFDNVKTVELTERIEELTAQRAEALNSEAYAEQQRANDLSRAQREMAAKYPALADPNSAAAKKFDEIYNQLDSADHPIFTQPPADQCRRISEMVAAELRLPAGVVSKVPASAPSAPAARPIQPASGAIRSAMPTNIVGQLDADLDAVRTPEQYAAFKEKLLNAR